MMWGVAVVARRVGAGRPLLVSLTEEMSPYELGPSLSLLPHPQTRL